MKTPKAPGSRTGVTLVELMIALAVVSIGVLGMIGAFTGLNRGIQAAKGRTMANNLAQEKIEVLKNKSYFKVLATTQTAQNDDLSPALIYDAYPNGLETLNVGGITFTRSVYIRKVNEGSGGGLTYYNWSDPDTGLKEILVHVVWFEGGEWKKVEMRNLAYNPDRTNLSASFSGTVSDTGGDPLAGATVRVQENPSRYAVTEADGSYTFGIESGSYTLKASMAGYFSSLSPLYPMSSGDQPHDFELTQIASGTITGTAYKRDHLVISQVVGSSINAGGQYQEWVEVYNPTTWTWTMATGLGTGNEVICFTYEEAGTPPIATTPDIDYRTAEITPGGYFLFANTGSVEAMGVVRTADAVYDTDSNWGNVDDVILTGSPSPAGSVILSDAALSVAYDSVGWNATSNGNAAKKNAHTFETQAIVQSVGFQVGESYTRGTDSAGVTDGQGRCYDSGDNENDFFDTNPLNRAPRDSSVTENCGTGTPAAGAFVFTNDTLSASALVGSDGAFSLSGVATGYWNLFVSSGVLISTGGTYGGASSGFTTSAGMVLMSSANIYGFVTGKVTGVDGSGLDEVLMYAGGHYTTTEAGSYTLALEPGDHVVYANYLTDDPAHVEISSAGVPVTLGHVSPDVDFVLESGGKIAGWVTTNGVDPLPNVPISAFKSGVEQGNGISGSDGYFIIWGNGISTGTYEVVPHLEIGEYSSPSTHTVSLSAGVTMFAGTFTVTGALGTISGSLTAGGSGISTGVLVIATTNTLTGSPLMPPTMNATLRSGGAPYYAASSDAEGHYELSVRGGHTYNIYAWHTTWNGTVPDIQVRQSTVTINPGQSEEEDLAW